MFQHHSVMHAPKLQKKKTAVSAKELLAKNVLRLREERELSQEELCHRAGVHRAIIGHIERQKRNVTLETLEALAVGLDVGISELFTESK
jgi:hypothetical protein